MSRRKKLIVYLEFDLTRAEYPRLLELAYGMTYARTGKGEFAVIDSVNRKGFKIVKEAHSTGVFLVLRDFALKKNASIAEWVKSQLLPCFIINPSKSLSKKLTDYYRYDMMKVHVTMSRSQFCDKVKGTSQHDEMKKRKALYLFRRGAFTALGGTTGSFNRRG